MTLSMPDHAFEIATARPRDRHAASSAQRPRRLFALAVTLLIHAVVALGLIMGVHVTATKNPPALMVRINPDLPKPGDEIALPLPSLQKPSLVAVPPPSFQVQAASSPVAVSQQPITAPAAPPAPVANPQSPIGEGRDNFLGRLLAQLNRYKQYPRAARQARIEGVVMLHFVMDATGRILSADIAKSSGRPVLDAEALALIGRAQPLPALPADFPTRTLDAVVPVAFSLTG